jgi:hypothetical protein
MVLKSGKEHHMPHSGRRPPFVGRGTITECFAKRIMGGSMIEKLSTILDVVKTHANGHLERREAKAMLLGALKDESRQVRWSAVYALGQMDDLQGLLEAVGNDCQVVRSMSTAMIFATLRKREEMEIFHPNDFMEKLSRTMADNIGSDDKSVAIYSASALSEIARRDPISVIKVISGMKETTDIGTIVRLRGVEMAANDALNELASKNRA